MDFWRQMDIVTPTDFEKFHVTIIGAGGIGSPTALAISKMGVEKITIFDNDIVEKHNLPNQM
ncbi:MAG: ThiF family adenylyltransferase, partial [Candidatus Thermoplasmatota archaeon]